MARPSTIPPVRSTDKLAPGDSSAVLKNGEKKRRWRPGTVASREIRKARRQVHPLITRTAIRKKLVAWNRKEGKEMRYKTEAVQVLREAASAFLVDFFQRANEVRNISQPQRHTLSQKDAQIGRATMGIPCLSAAHIALDVKLGKKIKKAQEKKVEE